MKKSNVPPQSQETQGKECEEKVDGNVCSKCGVWKGGAYGIRRDGVQTEHVCKVVETQGKEVPPVLKATIEQLLEGKECEVSNNPFAFSTPPVPGYKIENKNTVDAPGWETGFIEKGAELEHIRWAKWQNYLHSFLRWNNEIQAWVLPHEYKDRWQMQINTPYQMLSEKEKESDRREVREYLPLIRSLLSHQAQQHGEMLRNSRVGAPKTRAVALFNEVLEKLAARIGSNK